MIILTTTLLCLVVSMSGVVLDKVGTVWLFAALLDTLIAFFYIYAKYMFK